MTDSSKKRHHYDDTYSPVFEIPEEVDTGGGQSISELPEMPVEEPTRVKRGEGKPVRAKHKSKEKRTKEKTKSDPKLKRNTTADTAKVWQSVKEFFKSTTVRWLSGIFLGAFALYLLVAFVSYFANCISDQAAISNTEVGSLPPVGNAGGEGGARLSELLINESFGLGSFVIIIWIGAIALRLLSGKPKFKTVNFTIKCIVALITVSLIIGLLTLTFNSGVNWGGYHGRYVNEFIIGFVGWTGAVILCLALVATFFVICLRDFVNWILRKRSELAEKRRIAAELKAERERRERELEEMEYRERLDAIRAGEAKDPDKDSDPEDSYITFDAPSSPIGNIPPAQNYELEDEEEEEEGPARRPSSPSMEDLSGEDFPGNTDSSSMSDVRSLTEGVSLDGTSADVEHGVTVSGEKETPDGVTEGISREVISPDGTGCSIGAAAQGSADGVADSENDVEENMEMVVNVNRISQSKETEVKRAQTASSGSIKHLYKFPSPLLLREGEQKMTVDVEEQAANKERIRETLKYHGIPITSIQATIGPTVTLYEIRPGQGIKISRIKNLADDIALSLAATGVRIIAPIPGKGTVGIEVANAEPQTVPMRSIIMSRKYNESTYRLPVAIGSTIGNDVYMADLTKMPHLLVAGATGQGKSVGLNAIITSLLYKKRPDELKLVMIDPKEVEFSLYAMIEKHYLAKLEDSDAIVTDMSKVVDTLNSLCVEMDNRYKLLRTAQVRNIEEYNTKISQNLLREEDGHKFLPYIVLVVDEFADLIMTAGKEVETPIARLAQKARAIGIHVIIATQRPSTNVITGIIKANFPVRIAFKVSSGVDSKTILDATGAQALIGRGDMLISYNSEMVRVQCAFVDTPEVKAICEHISRQPFNVGPYILPEPLAPSDGESGGSQMSGGGERDSLFEEAAELVVTSGVGSTSGIQRRYSIGYNRAGKIMDQLEHYGVVGPSLGGKPRQVLMDMYGLQELLRTLNS